MSAAHCGTRRRGLSLVESLISLVISALLLTAVGAAFTGSANAIDNNDDFYKASQAARLSLARILTEVRRGSVDEASTSTSLHIITDSGLDVNYTYDAANQQIDYVTNSDGNSYVLARNVTKCTFVIQLGTDYNNAQCVKSVTMEIQVKVGTNSVFLTDSAALRRNIVY